MFDDGENMFEEMVREEAGREFPQSSEDLFEKVKECLRFHDVQALISIGAPCDEYDGEAVDIHVALESCETLDEFHHAVFEVMEEWFGELVGQFKDYADLSQDLWKLKGPHRTYKTKYSV